MTSAVLMAQVFAADVASMLAAQHRPFASSGGHVRFGLTRGGLVPVGVFAAIFAVISRGGGTTAVLTGAAVGAIGGAASLVVHELGHVRAARKASGVRAVRVSLIWGGAATYFEGGYRSGRDQMRVAIGGPAASLGIAVAVAAFVPLAPTAIRFAVFLLVLLNVAIGVLTLVPVAPLDGYKLVAGLAWSVLGSEDRARVLLRRVALGMVAIDVAAVAVTLAERPLLGTFAALAGGGLFAQGRIVRGSARAR